MRLLLTLPEMLYTLLNEQAIAINTLSRALGSQGVYTSVTPESVCTLTVLPAVPNRRWPAYCATGE